MNQIYIYIYIHTHAPSILWLCPAPPRRSICPGSCAQTTWREGMQSWSAWAPRCRRCGSEWGTPGMTMISPSKMMWNKSPKQDIYIPTPVCGDHECHGTCLAKIFQVCGKWHTGSSGRSSPKDNRLRTKSAGEKFHENHIFWASQNAAASNPT